MNKPRSYWFQDVLPPPTWNKVRVIPISWEGWVTGVSVVVAPVLIVLLLFKKPTIMVIFGIYFITFATLSLLVYFKTNYRTHRNETCEKELDT